jgi:DNA-binding NarL/FixJ family response regulator
MATNLPDDRDVENGSFSFPLQRASFELSSPGGSATDRKIRVLLAEDHTALRQALVGLLEDEPDIRVVAQASNGLEAVALARTTQPDVILMDFSMPGLDGSEAARRILADSSRARIIGFSMHDPDYIGEKMLAAGVAAFVTKGEPPDRLLGVIRRLSEE